MSEFENWFEAQDFYTNMRFIYGDKLFHKDGDAYRVLPVQMTYKAWIEQQAKIDELQKRIDVVLRKLEGDLAYVEQDQRRNFEFLQMAMIRCLRDDIKALRGEHE